jgi:hypothetical protein
MRLFDCQSLFAIHQFDLDVVVETLGPANVPSVAILNLLDV